MTYDVYLWDNNKKLTISDVEDICQLFDVLKKNYFVCEADVRLVMPCG